MDEGARPGAGSWEQGVGVASISIKRPIEIRDGILKAFVQTGRRRAATARDAAQSSIF